MLQLAQPVPPASQSALEIASVDYVGSTLDDLSGAAAVPLGQYASQIANVAECDAADEDTCCQPGIYEDQVVSFTHSSAQPKKKH